MKPVLVAWGIFNFNDIVHTSKTYSCQDRSRNTSDDLLIVAVQEVSVLHLPPRFCRSLISLLLLIHLQNIVEKNKSLLRVPPPNIVDSMLQRRLLTIDLAVKAYRFVRLHRLSPKSWFPIRPPTTVTARSDTLGRIYPTSLRTTPIASMDNVAQFNHSVSLHT